MITFVVHVENKPGVLTRVASLFRRRAYNIESLTVGHTETPGISRMTIVVDTDDEGAHHVEAHLYKLVNVLRVDNVTARPTVTRELAMIKVATTGEHPAADHAAGRRVPGPHHRRVGRLAGARAHRQRGQARQACSRCCTPTASSRWPAPARWPWAAAKRRGSRRPAPPRPATSARRQRRDRLLGVTRAAGARPSSPSTRRSQEFRHVMAVIYYDKDADLAPDPRPQGRHHRLRLAGPRPRAEPQGQRRGRARRPARGQRLGGQGRGRRAARHLDRRRRQRGRRDHDAGARHGAGRDLPRRRSSRTSPPARC